LTVAVRYFQPSSIPIETPVSDFVAATAVRYSCSVRPASVSKMSARKRATRLPSSAPRVPDLAHGADVEMRVVHPREQHVAVVDVELHLAGGDPLADGALEAPLGERRSAVVDDVVDERDAFHLATHASGELLSGAARIVRIVAVR
jgi:hypothetical protein